MSLQQQRLIETVQTGGGPPVYRFPGPPAYPRELLPYKSQVIVANWRVGNIAFVDPMRRSIESTVAMDRYESRQNQRSEREIRTYEPGPMAIANGKLFLGQVFSDNILVVDLPTKTVVKRIHVAGGGEGAIASSPDGRTVYFASNKDDALFSIDPNTYTFQRFPYPDNGRGSMSIACSANGSRVYVGVQRGYRSHAGESPGWGCFLAAFDPQLRKFVQSLPLFEMDAGLPDASTPAYILPEGHGGRVYAGMFQGRPGVYLLDGDPLRILRCSRPAPNQWNRHFEWVDPLALQFFRDDLLAIHRNNLELVLLDRETLAIKRTAFLGEAPNGPRDLLVFDGQAIISYPEKGGLLFLDLDSNKC